MIYKIYTVHSVFNKSFIIIIIIIIENDAHDIEKLLP